MKCFRDGDQFVVTHDDFVNLRESPAVFVPVDSEDGRALERAGVSGLSVGSLRTIAEELWREVKPVEQQLAERDAALAQEHVVAGEAMAWVEFLREKLTAITTAWDAADIQAWNDASGFLQNAVEEAGVVLAECDPGKPGSTQPQPLKEAHAALAGMRQVLDRLDATSCKSWCRKGWVCEPGKCPIYDALEPVNVARGSNFGRDRLALEREAADIVTKAANIPFEQLARVGIVDLMETVHRLEEAGLP